MRSYVLRKPPVTGFKIGLGPDAYAPVNESMRNCRPFKIEWNNEFMVIDDWEKESVHSESLPQRIPGREGTYEIHYFKWEPTTQERLL